MTKKTEILVITDRSGSMAPIAGSVIAGYNKFIEAQRAIPGEARVTYVQFDDVYEVLENAVPVSRAMLLGPESYKPRGSTALWDAIGRTLEMQGRRIKEEGWAELVIVVIITDGQNNASREFTHDRVKEMVAHAEKHGWEFVYLAANQDAMSAAANIGSANAKFMNFSHDSKGVAAAYGSTITATGIMRGGVTDKATLQAAMDQTAVALGNVNAPVNFNAIVPIK